MAQPLLMRDEAPRPSGAERAAAPNSAVPRNPPTALLVAYALALALGAGLGSAYWAISAGYTVGRAKVGPWTVWSRLGAGETEPYGRAVMARTGDIPLAVGEGLLLTAAADDAGRPLDARCRYRVGGTTPQARLWTLTVYDRDDRPVATDLMRSGFTSAEILRESDGRFFIHLARDAQPGNWLRMPEAGRVSLALRLYDTSAATGSMALEARALPAIEHLDCPA